MSSNSNSKGGGGRRNKGQRRASPRKSDPEPKKHAPRRLQNKLYIGDLQESVKKEDLEREFSRFGKVREVWLAHHPPGFAFVEFISTKDAADVIDAFDGKMLCGSKVRVEYAKANGPTNVKRGKRKDPPKTTSSSVPIDRISPLLSLSATHRSLAPPGGSTSRSIPPLLPLVRTSSPSRRGREEVRYRDAETLGVWDRASSPVPLLPPPKYRSRQSPTLARDRSASSSYRDLIPPPLLSPSITRDLHHVYPLLPPPPPPPLPLLSSRSSRNESRMRSPARECSRSPVYVRDRSSPVLLPSCGRLLGRTPPLPFVHDRSPSTENRYSPVRRSHGRDSPPRLRRSPPPSLRRSSPLLEDRRSPVRYKTQSTSSTYQRTGRSPPYGRYASPERATASYLPRSYASPSGRNRSPPSPRQLPSGSNRARKSLSESPRNNRSPSGWNRGERRSQSPVLRRNLSPRSPSPKRYRTETRRQMASRSPSANGRSASRRSYSPPPPPPPHMKRYSPVGPRSPPLTSAGKNHEKSQRSNRGRTAYDYRPSSPSPKRYSGSRSPPIVRSPSAYDTLDARRSPLRGRSRVRSSSPKRGRTPPRMYRQDSPRYRSPLPVPGRPQPGRTSPYRSRAGSGRSSSPRRIERRSPNESPPPRMNSRAYARSPSSRSVHSYRKVSPHVMRRSSPTPSPPPRSRRISPPQNRSSLPRRRSPSPRMSRNARAPSISPPPVARVMSRKSRSRSPSLLRLSHQSSLQGSKLSGDRRQFAMERSPSLRSPPPMPLHARYSPIDKPRRGLPPAKSDAPLYRSPSVSPPRQNSPIFRKGVGPESHRRSPRPMSPSLLARRRTRRSPSSSPGRKPAFSPKRRSQDWSPPPRAYQLGTAMKGHAMVDSWGDGNQRYSPKRKGAPSPPPSSPPQHRHRHKSKKLKA